MITSDCKPPQTLLTYVTDLPTLREFLVETAPSMTVTSYLKALIQSRPDRLLLRAKELSVSSYEALLLQLLPYTRAAGVELIVSHHMHLASTYNLPVQIGVAECEAILNSKASNFGVSVHSLGEAETAIAAGAHWLVLGHIFPSRCKPGLTPRSAEECSSILALAQKHNIPVHAIGGINFSTYAKVDEAFAGIYVMTETMEQLHIDEYTAHWRQCLAHLIKHRACKP
ncbi:MAG: thiamine phosphate synthase [Veillonella sp.]|uniref:thiamine phosphate synthase n=1 Tax=Veillonella sp. TaxID=1926307 RepID=UPI0025E63B13|nr:thiamine phosphate synthase [Veillonella sp.]MBS4912911.1 thiamine phosphate synthase [Veillonella sp.]